ncbi:hypothetical protein DYI37_00065 [Fulvimarina endophytica]|uniref:Uncharacterized protein n=1 Tax=Fulvimarina endophytica TaxID=2293836 RepID=A0A371X9M9_9HYPH|nr:hypothetical protein DYI37_00065 [Fulvimarina endophytica]
MRSSTASSADVGSGRTATVASDPAEVKPRFAPAEHRDAVDLNGAAASTRAASGSHRSNGASAPAVLPRSYPCRLDPGAIAAELEPFVEKAVAQVAAAVPSPDAILGRYIAVAALIRSVSFHEGKLLEDAMIAIGVANPDLVVLGSGVRLPVTAAALEAVAHNRSGALVGLSFDADAKAKSTYTPDLVTVNRRYRSALVIDVKRSLASYLDTHRLSELRTRMLAASLILPDWLYKERKRLAVDSVGIAIVDGSSGTSDHGSGLWSLSEIDDLLEIEGAAAAIIAMRARFADRVQALIKDEILRLAPPPSASSSGECAACAKAASAQDFGDPDPDHVTDDASGPGNHFQTASDAVFDGAGRPIRFGFARGRLHA